MAIKPILFNTEMVRAILDGHKTQTRRVVKPQPIGDMHHVVDGTIHGYWMDGNCQPFRPFYLTGDILYVRETFAYIEDTAPGCWHYRASANDADLEWFRNMGWKWRSSRYMPKEAARIFLRVKDVRVNRLHDMGEGDAIAEGFADSSAGTDSPLERFSTLWDKTIKREDLREYGWHANPWVWVIEFERCEKPEGWCGG